MFLLLHIAAGTKAFGGGTSTVYARCDNMWQHINYAGAVTGDRMWRMPLFNDYADRMSKFNFFNYNISSSKALILKLWNYF